MAGRCWYFGRIHLDLRIYGPLRPDGPHLNDYLGGVFDTLDGSSGLYFTYLPIVYEDDRQIFQSKSSWVEQGGENFYEVIVKFS